jgi:hypothetical protein
MLVTVQAVMLSQAMSEQFVSYLSQRLGWYRRLQPIAFARSVWQSLSDRKNISASFGDDPLVRAVTLSVLMQGHHDGALGWVQESTQMSYSNRWVTQASFLVATATQVAQLQRTPHEAKVSELLDDLKAATGSKEIEHRLDALIDAKNQNLSVRSTSKILGGKDHWQNHVCSPS